MLSSRRAEYSLPDMTGTVDTRRLKFTKHAISQVWTYAIEKEAEEKYNEHAGTGVLQND
jgi:hypothetical protein